MTIAHVPPPPATRVTGSDGGGEEPDLLDRLRSPSSQRPVVDEWLAGGLRAWLEDAVAGAGAGAGGGARLGPVVMRDGVLAHGAPGGRPKRMHLDDIRAVLTRVLFRLTVTAGPHRHPLRPPFCHPFEDVLCAISVTDRGPDIVAAVHRLGNRDRAALRATLRARAATIATQWRPVPPTWLPRTGDRLRVPLAGGAVVLSSTADLVLGRPSDGAASICAVRVHEGGIGLGRAACEARAARALALAETLRSGAAPWRVASYDPASGRLQCEDVREELLVEAVRDVLEVVGGFEAVRRRGERRGFEAVRGRGESRKAGGRVDARST